MNIQTRDHTSRHTADAPVIPAPRSGPFLDTHYPKNWEYCEDEDRWLPLLTRTKFTGGVNGTKATKRGLDPTLALARVEQAGGHVLREDVCGAYVARLRSASGGIVHLDKWVTVKVIGDQCIVKRSPENRADYNAWRASLIELRQIDAPDPDLLGMVCDKYEEVYVVRGERVAGSNPFLAKEAATAREKLVKMRAAALRPDPTALPSKRRSKAAS